MTLGGGRDFSPFPASDLSNEDGEAARYTPSISIDVPMGWWRVCATLVDVHCRPDARAARRRRHARRPLAQPQDYELGQVAGEQKTRAPSAIEQTAQLRPSR